MKMLVRNVNIYYFDVQIQSEPNFILVSLWIFFFFNTNITILSNLAYLSMSVSSFLLLSCVHSTLISLPLSFDITTLRSLSCACLAGFLRGREMKTLRLKRATKTTR